MKTVQDKYDWIKQKLSAGDQVWFYADEAEVLWDYSSNSGKGRICLIIEEADYDQINGRLYFGTEDFGVDFTQTKLKSTADVDSSWNVPVNEEIYCYE